MTEMTTAVIVDLCKKNGGYKQPHLNDQLYLQCKGFRAIKNLEPYTNCKCIWLDQNAISEVENLTHMDQLVTLFLQDNCLRRLNEGCFNGLSKLCILNLSNNNISRLPSNCLSACPLLETLQLAHNRFTALDALEGMMCCEKLSSIDCSYNMIETIKTPESAHNLLNMDGDDADDDESATQQGGAHRDDGECPDGLADNAEKDQQYLMVNNSEQLVSFWQQLPELGVLYLHGNELPRKCKFYRKRMICGLPQLMYLDERPIFPDERRTTEAWGRAGNEAEDAERKKIREEKLAEMEKSVRYLTDMKTSRTQEMREAAEKERERKMEEMEEWRKAMQSEWYRQREELSKEEREQRHYVENEEQRKDFEKKILSLVEESLKNAQTREARRKMEEEVERELQEEEKRIEMKRQQQRDKVRNRHDEMKQWINTFKAEENNISSQKNSSSASNKNKNKSEEEMFSALISHNNGKKSTTATSKSEEIENENEEIEEKARNVQNLADAEEYLQATEQSVEGVLGQLLSQVVDTKKSSSSSKPKNTNKNSSEKTSNLIVMEDDDDEETLNLVTAAREKNNNTNTNVAAAASTTTTTTKPRTTKNAHWDAFLTMESSRGKKRRF